MKEGVVRTSAFLRLLLLGSMPSISLTSESYLRPESLEFHQSPFARPDPLVHLLSKTKCHYATHRHSLMYKHSNTSSFGRCCPNSESADRSLSTNIFLENLALTAGCFAILTQKNLQSFVVKGRQEKHESSELCGRETGPPALLSTSKSALIGTWSLPPTISAGSPCSP